MVSVMNWFDIESTFVVSFILYVLVFFLLFGSGLPQIYWILKVSSKKEYTS